MQRHLYYYEYVNGPYEDVVKLMRDHPERIFQPATDAAVTHAGQVVASLSVHAGRLEVGKEVIIDVGDFESDQHAARLRLRWRAIEHEALFPSMEAELEVTPLSEGAHPLTQLALVGHYRPPLGLLGAVADAVIGHRVAEASVHRFVSETATRVEAELSG